MKKILMVDDDPTVRKLIGEVLQRAGYEVVLAKDGIDAMLLLKQVRPDLIVLDIMMPEFNGYDVCHKIKFNPEYKNLPIVLLTARSRELDPRLGSLMGIEYVSKTSAPQELLNKIETMLNPA